MFEILAAFVGAFVGAIATHQLELQRERRTALSGFHLQIDDFLIAIRREGEAMRIAELKTFVNQLESAVYNLRRHLNEKEAAKLTETFCRLSGWLRNCIRTSELLGISFTLNSPDDLSTADNSPVHQIIEILKDLRSTTLEAPHSHWNKCVCEM